MLVQNVSLLNQNYSKPCSFKSVYPVYHWCKINGKYKPATNQNLVHRCQRMLTGMLNKGGYRDKENAKGSAICLLSKYVATIDNDYKYVPFVRSFYNNYGGFKNSECVRSFEPMAYLVTGNDAAEFEQVFGKPLGVASKDKKNNSSKELEKLITGARVAYATKGPQFIKTKCEKFIDKESGVPMELHTIFDRSDKTKPPKLIKFKFFIRDDKNNPLITNGIIDFIK